MENDLTQSKKLVAMEYTGHLQSFTEKPSLTVNEGAPYNGRIVTIRCKNGSGCEPGSSRSSLCTYIVLTWCSDWKAPTANNTFSTWIELLKEFWKTVAYKHTVRLSQRSV